MQFPTTKLRDGIQRPLVMLHLEATNGWRVNVDAFVDTWADISLFSFSTAAQLGIDLTNAPEQPIGSAIGALTTYRTAEVIIEIRRSPEVYRWQATVGFVPHRMAYAMLGTRGFFEFFRLAYDASLSSFEIESCRNFQCPDSA